MPDDQRCEIIDGELLMMPTPTSRHQMILVRVMTKLFSALVATGLGVVLPAPIDVILAEDSVVQPDVLFISQERRSIIDPAGGVRGAPDLVVEILSPSTSRRDLVVKRKLYAKYGVKEYWIVDPDEVSVEVSILAEGELNRWRVFNSNSTLTSPLCPTLAIPVSELFPS